jgi:tRNA pseudouridine38-40 synthase
VSAALRCKGTLAYDGSAYQGFQRQAGGIPTVQAAVEAAVERVVGHPVAVIGAGRTDTGVHASGQVIAFDAAWRHEPEALLRAVNAQLPPDVALQDLAFTSAGFHPRFDAWARLYRYRVFVAEARHPLLNRAWHIRADALDGAAMDEAAAHILGRRDCGAFGQPPQGTNTVRTLLRSEWAHEPAYAGLLWTYTIEADAFLQHMVRRIVGMLVDIGRGGRTTAQFVETVQRAKLGDPWTIAPPHGLTLEHVTYDSAGERRPPEDREDVAENVYTETGRY